MYHRSESQCFHCCWSMALIHGTRVFCCELYSACVTLGILSLVVYFSAFVMELWWLVEADMAQVPEIHNWYQQHGVLLPAPAYLLASIYFITFLVSLFLLSGLFLV